MIKMKVGSHLLAKLVVYKDNGVIDTEYDRLTAHIVHVICYLSLASLLWDIGKQNSPRCNAAERGVPSGAILFAQSNFIE